MKPTGVPGKQESGQKYNPFSALAAAAAQSAKAAKKRPSHDDNDPDYEKGKKRARDPDLKQLQKSTGKAPQKQLPAKLLKKKSGSKSKPAFTGAIKKPHAGITQVQWHSTNQKVPEKH